MRSLSLAARTNIFIPNVKLSCTVSDLDENVLYIASETQNLDGEVEVQIWRTSLNESVSSESSQVGNGNTESLKSSRNNSLV